jgi:hypothetical protein
MLHIFKAAAETDYKKYRWFFTAEGTLVVGGKNEEQNELVLKHFLKPVYSVVHTSLPGSPFMIVISDDPSKKDVEEAAVFCACFSKQWKQLKKSGEKVAIDVFKGNQLYKMKTMKAGTFGVKGTKKTLLVVPELILIFQKGKLRAVPILKKNKNYEVLAEITPGKLTKEQAADKIIKKIKETYQFPISRDELMAALPSDKVGVE